MNHTSHPDAAALRHDIDHTRQRMDATIDALGERFQPRHLLDEALGYLRQNHTSLTQPLNAMREKLSHQTDAAVQAVVHTVKQNPLPLLLMGAGVAWMVYNHRRSAQDTRYSSPGGGYDDDVAPFRGTIHYDPDAHMDRPLEFRPPAREGAPPEGAGGAGPGSYAAQAREVAHDAAHAVRDKLAQAGDYAREKFDSARERAGEFGQQVRDRSSELYSRAREGVSHTVQAHPLETGLLCLAAGVLAGLAIPTPAPVNRRLGPTVDRLKERALSTAQEALQTGRRATEAAVAAAKAEVTSAADPAAGRLGPGSASASLTAAPVSDPQAGVDHGTAATTGPAVSASPSS